MRTWRNDSHVGCDRNVARVLASEAVQYGMACCGMYLMVGVSLTRSARAAATSSSGCELLICPGQTIGAGVPFVGAGA